MLMKTWAISSLNVPALLVPDNTIWPDNKIVKLFLNPTSLIEDKALETHDSDFIIQSIRFAQDFIYSMYDQRKLFYGKRFSCKQCETGPNTNP